MLYGIGKKRGLFLPPPPQSPSNFLAFLPPPHPPREGRGGESCLHSIILHAADSAPHAESTNFSRELGVGVGDI